VQQLGEPERKLFLDALRRHRPEIQPLRQAYGAAQQALRTAIAAEPWDAAAVTAAFAEMRRTGEAVQAAVQAAVTEAMGQLPPGSRRFLAEFRNRPNPAPNPGPNSGKQP
jgi:uncharacterized membrane protein